MDTFQIETAQNITIQQNVAHISTRIGSYVIDLLIIVAYYIIAFLIMSWANFRFDQGQNWILTLCIFLPTFFYSLAFEVLFNGQTPGKYLNKIRVVRLDGSKPTFGSYLIRWFLRLIDFNLASGSVALLTILLNGKGQRLGDIAAGTTVISEKKRVSLRDTLAEEVVEAYTPTYSQVTLLSDADIHKIKDVYTKAKRTGNHAIILKLHIKILEITNISTDKKPMEFIETVLKDYNYYTQ